MSSSDPFNRLLGPQLLTKRGVLETSQVIQDSFVALYFSAHWCPPCRGFTPQLIKFYEHYKALKGSHNLEIVFISSDKSESIFEEYYRTMPWSALPYSMRSQKNLISSRYEVRGIPTLVILDKNGEMITIEGRRKVLADPLGDGFPWPSPSFSSDLGLVFVGKSGRVPAETLGDKYIGLFFSASWCVPCQVFTAKLIAFYHHHLSKGRNDFEIIFISADKDETAFLEYYHTMPWITLPYQDERIKLLSNRFSVREIPLLILVDPTGSMITTNGKDYIERDPEGDKFPYNH
mmetsp:Transcript_2720/g.2875  ORF Transcript_2720/g.2875 Transcript_2720/m.2875 type:complete len:290 (+) Transcript_2720:87-956(+)